MSDKIMKAVLRINNDYENGVTNEEEYLEKLRNALSGVSTSTGSSTTGTQPNPQPEAVEELNLQKPVNDNRKMPRTLNRSFRSLKSVTEMLSDFMEEDPFTKRMIIDLVGHSDIKKGLLGSWNNPNSVPVLMPFFETWEETRDFLLRWQRDVHGKIGVEETLAQSKPFDISRYKPNSIQWVFVNRVGIRGISVDDILKGKFEKGDLASLEVLALLIQQSNAFLQHRAEDGYMSGMCVPGLPNADGSTLMSTTSDDAVILGSLKTDAKNESFSVITIVQDRPRRK